MIILLHLRYYYLSTYSTTHILSMLNIVVYFFERKGREDFSMFEEEQRYKGK